VPLARVRGGVSGWEGVPLGARRTVLPLFVAVRGEIQGSVPKTVLPLTCRLPEERAIAARMI
jgi:hypothetical protein